MNALILPFTFPVMADAALIAAGVAGAGALAALADKAHLDRTVAQVAAARDRIAAIARDNGLTTLPSATNFVAVDCGGDGDFARAVLTALGDRGVFVRMPWVAPQNRCIRVSCGPETDLAAFAEALPPALSVLEQIREESASVRSRLLKRDLALVEELHGEHRPVADLRCELADRHLQLGVHPQSHAGPNGRRWQRTVDLRATDLQA